MYLPFVHIVGWIYVLLLSSYWISIRFHLLHKHQIFWLFVPNIFIYLYIYTQCQLLVLFLFFLFWFAREGRGSWLLGFMYEALLVHEINGLLCKVRTVLFFSDVKGNFLDWHFIFLLLSLFVDSSASLQGISFKHSFSITPLLYIRSPLGSSLTFLIMKPSYSTTSTLFFFLFPFLNLPYSKTSCLTH